MMFFLYLNVFREGVAALTWKKRKEEHRQAHSRKPQLRERMPKDKSESERVRM